MIKKIVLVGASNNTEKYWNKILKDLVGKWYTVYPINPKEEEIEWIKAYKSLKNFLNYNLDYDVINFVVRPSVVYKEIKENIEKIKDKKIWCQPWASDDDVIKLLFENWFKDYIVNSCIMLEDLKNS
jgi:predicted CoA-binding protein